MKEHPVGICSVCGNYSYNPDHVGASCHAHHQGKACNGVMQDARAEDAWELCPACRSRGLEHEVDCPQCAGAGWLYSP